MKYNIKYVFKGKSLTKEQLCKVNNINWAAIQSRLHNGWSLERAVTQPLKKGSDMRRFEANICPWCYAWGGWYDKRKYDILVWEECTFCKRYL